MAYSGIMVVDYRSAVTVVIPTKRLPKMSEALVNSDYFIEEDLERVRQVGELSVIDNGTKPSGPAILQLPIFAEANNLRDISTDEVGSADISDLLPKKFSQLIQ